MSHLSGSREWVVAQIGSRQHYAVPRSLERRGQLDRFYTELWSNRGLRFLSRFSQRLKLLGKRFHAELPESKVSSFNIGALFQRSQDWGGLDESTKYRSYLRVGQWFGDRVVADLQRHPPDADKTVAFAFCTGALEIIRYLKSVGVPTLVDQIDVARVEQSIIREEVAKWPGWQSEGADIPDEYFDRVQQEWAEADGVIVNSSWTRSGLIEQGVAAEKIHVVPLAYESPAASSIDRSSHRGQPLRVLFLGQVILRKGLPYLFEAARLLLGEPVQFDVVGYSLIARAALATAPSNVRIAHHVPAEVVSSLYAAADVFVLPTMSDGFAITQLEAMAHGLPVIATPRCGDVVLDGINGLIVPPGDARGLANAIGLLAADRDRVDALSAAARRRVMDFSLERFGERLDQIGSSLFV